MEEINIYCDESCHLENDNAPNMILGAVYCPKEKLKEIKHRIKEIKAKYDVKQNSEIKWTKVSLIKLKMYEEIVDYFFDNDDLSFRCVIANKEHLQHNKYNQTHDEWYYKMYFTLLKVIFNPSNKYNIYLDIKDTHSDEKIKNLKSVCRNSRYDFSGRIINKMQPIRSNEVQIMQITDILIGAIGYINRYNLKAENLNQGKVKLIRRIQKRSGYSLIKSTLYRESKLNIFVWEANYYEKHKL